jgi:hypothetical protein
MPTKVHLDTLMREAIETATWREHRMGAMEYFSFTHARSTCQDCGAEVDVRTRPAPNETNIGGPAVAVSCTGKASP